MIYNVQISPSGGPPATTLLSRFPAPLLSLILSEKSESTHSWTAMHKDSSYSAKKKKQHVNYLSLPFVYMHSQTNFL